MLRFLYLAGIGYLAICLLAIAVGRVGGPVHSGTGAVALAVPSGRGDGGTWFAGIKPFCNSVEVETAQQRNPAPGGAEGQGYSAACYALAGRIEQARTAIERLSGDDRSYAASIVFGVGHPVADAGDDKSAGPIMELVIEFQPDNYMALYHAGMSEYVLGQPGLAEQHLRRFLELYHANDGWRTNAVKVLQRLSGGP
jgi:tetratricopeptide (TPR) repeat protein